jgi:hypothetical protein
LRISPEPNPHDHSLPAAGSPAVDPRPLGTPRCAGAKVTLKTNAEATAMVMNLTANSLE